MSGHSQGPWRYEKGIVYDANNRVVIVFQQPTPEQAEANARLIAAAPDLLTACQIHVTAESAEEHVWAVEVADAAIAKALGND